MSTAAQRDTGYRQTDSAQHRLNQGGDNHAKRHTAYRLTREAHDIVAALASKAAAESAHPACRLFSVHVQDCRDYDGEQKLNADETKAADLGEENQLVTRPA